MRDMHLFRTLNVLRALKPPDLVRVILHAHPDVASAAEVYPLGLDSLTAQQPPVSEGGPRGRGFVYAGSGSEGDRLVAGMIAAHQGDPSAVQGLLREAHRLYLVDTDTQDPNL